MKWILAAVTFFLFNTMAVAEFQASDDPKTNFSRANKAFDAKDYETATLLYEGLVENYESVPLYHNLSLSYFYNGNLGKAIVYMERAKRLAPMNATVRKDLKLLYENVDSEIQTLPPFFLRAWSNGVSRLLSPLAWLVFHIVVLLAAVVLLYAYLLNGFDFGLHFYYVRGFIIGLLVLSLITGLLAYNAYVLKTNTNYAVITSSQVPLRVGAESNSTETQLLNEGLKVTIHDEISDFYKVKLGDYTEGWVAKKNLTII